MNNAAYWKKRFRQLESARHASDGKRYLECEELFTAALRELNELINAWFGRFARNNGVMLEDARKLLTKSELAELKWDVKQYIKAGEANALTGEFEKQLENASAKYHISRLEAIKLQVQMECERLYGNLTDEIDDHIRFQYLDAYYHTAYEIDRGFGVGHTLEAISTDKLESIVSKPWAADGKNFATRLGESKVKLINNVHASLTQMCMNGNNPDKAIAQLAKAMNGDKVRAGRIIMTESAYFAQEAQQACFNELGVEEYEIVATLDNRTCDGTCQGEDGKHYPMKMFEAGVTAPPFHPNCRCCTAPYFDDDDEGERIAKDADGKNYTVSSDMTYPQWKKEFVKDGFQKGAKSGIIKSLDVDDFELMSETQGITSEVSNVISETIKGYEKQGGMYISSVEFGDFYDETTGKPALFQVMPNQYGLTVININNRLLGGKTIEEVDAMIARAENNLPQSLKEAVIHECGHAKLINGHNISEIKSIYSKLKDVHIGGISPVGYSDGAECIAEVEVMLHRHSKVPAEAMELYNKYVKGPRR